MWWFLYMFGGWILLYIMVKVWPWWEQRQIAKRTADMLQKHPEVLKEYVRMLTRKQPKE